MKRNLFICIALLFSLLEFSCTKPSLEEVVSFDIEFDGGKRNFYDKYDLWLTIEKAAEVNELRDLIKNSKNKINCINSRPVMWEIDVFANYVNGETKHILKLGSNTSRKENLEISRDACYENKELILKLKQVMHVDKIEKFEGRMRQIEFEKMISE